MTDLPNNEILTGNIVFLKQQIVERIQARAEAQLQGDGATQVPINAQPEFADKIAIRMIFEGKTETGKLIKNHFKTIRLVKENYKTVDIKIIQAYARKILLKFGGEWFMSLGKEGHNYVNYKQGVQLQQMYTRTEADAKKWVESILDINGFAPEWRLLKREGSVAPELAYPETPGKTTIANQLVDEAQRRPYGTVKFMRAKIWFPESTKVATLCTRSGYIIPNLDFLTRTTGSPPASSPQRTSRTNSASAPVLP